MKFDIDGCEVVILRETGDGRLGLSIRPEPVEPAWVNAFGIRIAKESVLEMRQFAKHLRNMSESDIIGLRRDPRSDGLLAIVDLFVRLDTECLREPK